MHLPLCVHQSGMKMPAGGSSHLAPVRHIHPNTRGAFSEEQRGLVLQDDYSVPIASRRIDRPLSSQIETSGQHRVLAQQMRHGTPAPQSAAVISQGKAVSMSGNDFVDFFGNQDVCNLSDPRRLHGLCALPDVVETKGKHGAGCTQGHSVCPPTSNLPHALLYTPALGGNHDVRSRRSGGPVRRTQTPVVGVAERHQESEGRRLPEVATPRG